MTIKLGMARGASSLGAAKRQRGASIIEFAVVGPLITLMGLSTVQYGLVFNTKNVINHAAFMAARAGSTNHALLNDASVTKLDITRAYVRALAPLFGGGGSQAEIAASVGRAAADMAGNMEIQIISPTVESFEDWADPALALTVGRGKGPNGGNAQVIPNTGQATKSRAIGAKSGQSIQDANVLKLRIVHGYSMGVPFIRNIYITYLQWMYGTNPDVSAFERGLIARGRIPLVSQVTVQMQSEPIKQASMISRPGAGNGGVPPDPKPPYVDPDPPADCATVSAGDCGSPTDPGTGDGGGDGTGGSGPVCDVSTEFQEQGGDNPVVLFAFDSDQLTPAFEAMLDAYMAEHKDDEFDGVALEGYTDQLGDEAYNEDLSLRRAQAVERYLRDHDFTSKPISVQGLGEQDPVIAEESCANAASKSDCLARNRRVSITLVKSQLNGSTP
jgi:outer membrane protein OmpA-like peptidoglycan-associated protein/Flp pilus assembly protein TadG